MRGCRILTPEELKRLLEAAHLRERVLFESGLYFGLRITEALALKFGHVSGQFLSIQSLKGSKNQTFPIPAKYAAILSELRADYECKKIQITAKTPLFLSNKSRYTQKPMTRQHVAYLIRAIARQQNISGKVGFHCFRKLFVTRIYNAMGCDIIKTRSYSRHKSIGSLQSYIESTEGTDFILKLDW